MPAPSRHLFVKQVPGITYAQVASSTNLSGWQQPADRTAGMGQVVFDEAPPASATSVVRLEEVWQVDDDPPADSYPTDLRTFATQALNVFWEDMPARSGARLVFLHDGWRMVTAFPGDDDPVGYTHRMEAQYGADRATPAVRPSDTVWRDAWRSPWPAGAIGYEVEQYEVAPGIWGAYSDVLSLDLTVTLDPYVSNGLIAGVVCRVVINEAWGSGVTRIDGAQVRATGAEAGMDDRTTYGEIVMELPQGRLEAPVAHQFTVNSFPPELGRTGALGVQWAMIRDPWVDHIQPTVGEADRADALMGVSLAGVYRIRPPRIRWIYPDDEVPSSTPYRRTYPRDDSLAGGPGRNFPRPRSIQSSNRIGGGYL